MFNTPKLYLTISNHKILLFAVILIFVSYANVTVAQNDFNSISEDYLAVSVKSNVKATNPNNDVNTDSKIYIDFTQDNISVNDELNEYSKTYNKIHGKFTPITGNVRELYKFFKAIKKSKTKNEEKSKTTRISRSCN